MSATCIRTLCITASALALLSCADSAAPTTAMQARHSSPAGAQDKGWSEPENLGATVNATGFDTRNAMISVNGKSLYFGSDRPGGSGAVDLHVSHRDNPNAEWQQPVNLGPTINSSGTDNNAHVTDDGHDLLFNAVRPGGCGGVDLWTAHRADAHDDLGWETPVNLGCTINSSSSDSGPVLWTDPSTNTTMLFFASTRPGGQGSNDFYVSTLGGDGAWGPPVVIPSISTPHDDNKLAISRDGLTVYFSSNRPGGSAALSGFNIWVATRASTQDAWSDAEVAVEAAGLPALAANGKSLYMVQKAPFAGPFKNHLAVSTRTRGP